MTQYPVQCFDNNGEPYGKYVHDDPTLWLSAHYSDYVELRTFKKMAEANIFPFPSGTMEKQYQRDQMEVVWQFSGNKDYNGTCVYANDEWVVTDRYFLYKRQIFRLLPQPVEKEPETVDLVEYKKITGFDTPAERRAYEEGREDEAKVLFAFIQNWTGKTNSGLGCLLAEKFKERQQSSL